MDEIHKVIESGEQVLWQGRPKFLPFFISSFIVSAFGLIFLGFGLFTFIEGIKTGDIFFIFFPHFWIGLFLVFLAPLYTALTYKYVHYAITNKRAIIQTGLIGRDFQIADFDKITNAEVNVNLIDKLFGAGSGSILISTAGTFTHGKRGPRAAPYTISHIANPYEVFKYLKKVSHDVKTDIHYPNEYRPSQNPGYKTHYGGKNA